MLVRWILYEFEVGKVLVDEDLLRGRLSVATPMEMMSGATTRDRVTQVDGWPVLRDIPERLSR